MDEENSVPTEHQLAAWETPTLTTLDAGDAELQLGPGSDGPVGS